MASNNIFDTRNIIKQTPKIGNRFLLEVNPTQLNDIVNGKTATAATPTTPAVAATPGSKLKRLNTYTGGDSSIYGTQGAAGKTSNDILNLSLLSCTIPAFEFEAAELNHFQDTVKHITKFSTSNDISAVYYDYINGSATAIMLAWQSRLGFKLTGEIGYKSQYVCDMDLYVYGPNRPGYRTQESEGDSSSNEALMQFKIFNAYPRSVDIGEFSYDNTEIKKVTVQFGYDMIIPYKNNKRKTRVKTISGNTGFNENLNIGDKNDSSSPNTAAATTDDGIYNIYVNNKYQQ